MLILHMFSNVSGDFGSPRSILVLFPKEKSKGRLARRVPSGSGSGKTNICNPKTPNTFQSIYKDRHQTLKMFENT